MDKNKIENNPVKVAISIPTEGVTTPESYDNRLLFAFHLGKYQAENPDKFEFYWYTAGSMLTPMARELLAKQALNAGCDFILMIDDDMLSCNDLFERLYKTMEERPEVDLVAPLAFTRNPPHYPVIYETKSGFDPINKQPFFQTTYVRNYPKGKLVECDAVGFGAALIRMSLIRKMPEPYFMSTTATGEDILFCVNAKKVGGRIFMDTGIQLIHLGQPIHVDEEYAEAHWKGNGENIRRNFTEFRKYD